MIYIINNCNIRNNTAYNNGGGIFNTNDSLIFLNHISEFTGILDTIITKIGNYFFTTLGNLLFSLKLSDILFTYILGKKKSFKLLNLKSKDFRLCAEIPISAKKMNFSYVDTHCYERERIAGKKKVNALKDGFLILINMIKIYFKY